MNVFQIRYNSVFQFHHRLSPGETLVFNNRRFAHGRTKFMLNGGVRHFSVCKHNLLMNYEQFNYYYLLMNMSSLIIIIYS